MCPSTLTKNHLATGGVAPINKTVTYGVIQTSLSGQNKCWITKNLGAADSQPSSVTDPSESAAGWYWQFNRKQGYKHDGYTCTPSTMISTIDESSDWTLANDPCDLLLGSGWRIPTQTEWINVDATGGWTDYNGPYNSVLKLHAAGAVTSGVLSSRGTYGFYWSSNQRSDAVTYGYLLLIATGNSIVSNYPKVSGYSVRCIKD
jgi:hypothetical protein